MADTADGSPTNDVSNDNSERLQCLILGLIASFHIVFNGIIGEETEIKCVLGVHAPETTIIPLLWCCALWERKRECIYCWWHIHQVKTYPHEFNWCMFFSLNGLELVRYEPQPICHHYSLSVHRIDIYFVHSHAYQLGKHFETNVIEFLIYNVKIDLKRNVWKILNKQLSNNTRRNERLNTHTHHITHKRSKMKRKIKTV